MYKTRSVTYKTRFTTIFAAVRRAFQKRNSSLAPNSGRPSIIPIYNIQKHPPSRLVFVMLLSRDKMTFSHPRQPKHKPLHVAIEMVRKGSIIRKASEFHRVPHSALHNNIAKINHCAPSPCRPSRLSSLSAVEEKMVLTLLFRYADRGISLRRRHVKEAIEIIVPRMTTGRRLSLPFKNCSPSSHYLRDFTRRYRTKIRFAKPLRQEALRFKAVNGDVLTSHFAVIEKMIREHAVDASRIWNCDEMGATPGRDANGKQNVRVCMTRAGSQDAKIGHFLNIKRVTILPAVSANGASTPPMFVLRAFVSPIE